jgi:hypothetical protein
MRSVLDRVRRFDNGWDNIEDKPLAAATIADRFFAC